MSFNRLEMDFNEFKELMQQTTKNLKELTQSSEEMRWQYGSQDWYEDFVKAHDAANGWINSHC